VKITHTLHTTGSEDLLALCGLLQNSNSCYLGARLGLHHCAIMETWAASIDTTFGAVCIMVIHHLVSHVASPKRWVSFRIRATHPALDASPNYSVWLSAPFRTAAPPENRSKESATSSIARSGQLHVSEADSSGSHQPLKEKEKQMILEPQPQPPSPPLLRVYQDLKMTARIAPICACCLDDLSPAPCQNTKPSIGSTVPSICAIYLRHAI
jgi:hypothetical protein